MYLKGPRLLCSSGWCKLVFKKPRHQCSHFLGHLGNMTGGNLTDLFKEVSADILVTQCKKQGCENLRLLRSLQRCIQCCTASVPEALSQQFSLCLFLCMSMLRGFFFFLYRWIMIRIPIPQSRDILGKSIFALPVTGKKSQLITYLTHIYNIQRLVLLHFSSGTGLLAGTSVVGGRALHWLQNSVTPLRFNCHPKFNTARLFYPPLNFQPSTSKRDGNVHCYVTGDVSVCSYKLLVHQCKKVLKVAPILALHIKILNTKHCHNKYFWLTNSFRMDMDLNTS